MTTEPVLADQAQGVAGFLAAYHDKGVPYLLNPATRPEALRSDHRLRQHRAEEPDRRGDHDPHHGRQRLLRHEDGQAADDARPTSAASLEYQVKFFMEQGTMKSAPDLDKAIVTDLL